PLYGLPDQTAKTSGGPAKTPDSPLTSPDSMVFPGPPGRRNHTGRKCISPHHPEPSKLHKRHFHLPAALLLPLPPDPSPVRLPPVDGKRNSADSLRPSAGTAAVSLVSGTRL